MGSGRAGARAERGGEIGTTERTQRAASAPPPALLSRLAPPQRAAQMLALQRGAGNAALARALRAPAPTGERCACGGRIGADGQCERCRRRGAERRPALDRAVLQRDGLAPGDRAPQDAVDRAAGGRARRNLEYGRQCEPYAIRSQALYQSARLRILVPRIVDSVIPSPASPDAANLWRRYLDGVGGVETHDGILDPSDRIAAAFAADERHAPAEDAMLDRIADRLPGVMARLRGRSSMTLTLDELGIPAATREFEPHYDNDARTIAANLAGGVGSSTVHGRDSRRIDGTVTIDTTVSPESRLYVRVQVRAEFIWTLRDAIDFCPGNAGNPYLQEWLTIPMSRLEASGITRPVGLVVRFRRVRHDAPRLLVNPDVR